MKETAQQWNDLGTPIDIAHENRKRSATAVINKTLEYFDSRFGMTGFVVLGWANPEKRRSEVGM